MDFAAGQVPYEPGIHRAEKQLSAAGFFTCAINIIQYPFYFCCGEIGVYDKPCFIAEKLFKSLVGKSGARIGCTPALPDDGVVYRLSCGFVP